MAEEKIASEVVKTVSDGTVKITVERYQELMEKAAEKAPIIYRTVHKTPAMVAGENKMWGAVFMGGGLSLTLIGGVIYRVGLKQSKAL